VTDAQPGVAPDDPDPDAEPPFELEVDGEVFEVEYSSSRGSSYTWLTGPSPGYGFGSSGPKPPSLDDHRQAIRGFLEQIDPETGHIGPD
jgi:hypothetical protein